MLLLVVSSSFTVHTEKISSVDFITNRQMESGNENVHMRICQVLSPLDLILIQDNYYFVLIIYLSINVNLPL